MSMRIHMESPRDLIGVSEAESRSADGGDGKTPRLVRERETSAAARLERF